MAKKILILVESLKVGGGSERFAAILGSELHDQGFEVSYLTLMDEDPKFEFKGDYYTLNMGYIYVNSLKRAFDLLRYSPKIKRICEDLDIDTIISVSEMANFYAVLSCRLFGNNVRLIISQHINPEIFLDDPLKNRLIKFFYPQADEIICVSKEIEKVLNESYHLKNTSTIYNMMDIAQNHKLSENEVPDDCKHFFKGNNDKYFTFINVGRLKCQKGQWFLIRSFRKVVDKHQNARLFILGKGDLKVDLRKNLEGLIDDLDLNENVFLLGEQENVFPFLKKSDCFILSSLWEGFGLVLVEALSMDLPIISTDCKVGPREVLSPELDLDKDVDYPYFGKHAILTQNFPNQLLFKNLEQVPLNESEKMLSDLMIRIIEDSSLRKTYSHGSGRAEDFSNKKIIKDWDEILLYD
ncbi:glycosyltransferase [Methanobacterium petrolearium]|uniref:glycosyltransferase n=1 Tax=Methanobacterium petrolearium TaxID=710190 RepID=UPI001AE5D65E|nr:glycosyltransferase [Methanobacterium petrolearium]MBP1945334.1 glycosyltransferase involved in cell wall biosynthesis [Methanobacterium petrolearium]